MPNANKKEKFDFKHASPDKKKHFWRFALCFVVIASAFLIITCVLMINDKNAAEDEWDQITDGLVKYSKDDAAANTEGAVQVSTGVYIDNINTISIRNYSYDIQGVVWFRWRGDENLNPAGNIQFYNCSKQQVTVTNKEQENGVNLQAAKFSLTMVQEFDTRRFPLESAILGITYFSTLPRSTMDLVDDGKSSMGPEITIPGYSCRDHKAIAYDSARQNLYSSEASMKANSNPTMSFFMLLNRNSLGLYIKTVIALFITFLWSFLLVYVSANLWRIVILLTAFSGSIFGIVSNIMVGANLLPDPLDIGLVVLVNTYAIIIVMASSLTVMMTNHLYEKTEDAAYTAFFGNTMLKIIIAFTVLGNLVMPLSAYLF